MTSIKWFINILFKFFGVIFGITGFIVVAHVTIKMVDVFNIAHDHNLSVQDVSLLLTGTRYSYLLQSEGRMHITIADTALQRADAEQIALLFPNLKEREQVLNWGRELFAIVRNKHTIYQKLFTINPERQDAIQAIQQLDAVQITDALAAHVAWQRLLATPGVQIADLFNIHNVVTLASNSTSHYKKLLLWAQQRRMQLHTVNTFTTNSATLTIRPAPPALPWFDDWIIYEQYAITPEVFAARTADIITIFGEPEHFYGNTWDALMAYGKNVANERYASGDKILPAAYERTWLVAALDRLSGLDPVWLQRTNAAREQMLDQAVIKFTTVRDDKLAVYGQYPVMELIEIFPFNDDLIFFQATADARHIGYYYQIDDLSAVLAPSTLNTENDGPLLRSEKIPGLPNADYWGHIFVFFGTAMLLSWPIFISMRLLVVTFIGRLMGLYNIPHYQTFAKGLEQNTQVYFLLNMLIILISWACALATADPLLVFWSLGPHTLLAGLAMTVFVGGIITEVLKNISILIIIRMGWNPLCTWIDELLIVTFMVSVLLFFDNHADTIVAVGMMGFLTPWTLAKLRSLFEQYRIEYRDLSNPPLISRRLNENLP